MRRPLPAVGLLLLCCASARIVHAEVPDPLPLERPDDNSHVRAIYKRAQTAFEAGEFEQARGLFLQAWSIRPSAEIALGLGQTEFELKRFRDCSEHLDFAIRNLGPTVSEAVLANAKKALAEARTQVAVLHVTTHKNGAEILIDGKTIGSAPLDSPVYLDPGNHEIAARMGQSGITRPVSLQAGQEFSINLPFAPDAHRDDSPWSKGAPRASAHDTRASPAATDQQRQPRSLVPAIIGGATFLAAATAAVVFRIDSDSQFNDADALRARLARTGCQGSSDSGDCAALMTANRNGDRSRNWSNAGLLVATGALLGTVAYWYWPSSDSKTSARNQIRLSAGVTPGATGILLMGNY